MNGFENEKDLLINLNDKKYYGLNENLRRLILKLNGIVPNDIIYCRRIGGQEKTDLRIIIGINSFNISVKKGFGNSVHQEKVEDLIIYLKENISNSSDVFDDIRHFIWGDNTLNGTGEVIERMSQREYCKRYPKKVTNIKNYLSIHHKELIKRFLLNGKDDKNSIDYLYYGSSVNGYCISADELIRLHSNFKTNNNSINLGRLTFQAWNRNLKGVDKTEVKRGSIQLKWSSLPDDIKLFKLK